ncbi:MAG: hypothetical protein H0U73_02240 [Tatlockia sp.]|nr:hypothetical protein [Tatlockia sp.]
MKIISKLVCATVFLSPLLLTGCQTMGELFGDSRQYNNPPPYGYPDASRRVAVERPSAAISSRAPASRVVPSSPYTMRKTTKSGVPIDAQSAAQSTRHSGSQKIYGTSSSNNVNSNSSSNTTKGRTPNNSSSTSNAVVVPHPVAPATGMVAPTAQ